MRPELIAFVLALTLLTLWGCDRLLNGGATSSGVSVGKVDGKVARELVAEGAQLLDVRTPSEFSQGHIDGALNIPVGEIQGRLSELTSKSKPVVVYCRSGGRSAKAAKLLTTAGFEAVYDLGGQGNW